MKDYTSPDYTEEDHHATEPEEVLKKAITKIQARIRHIEQDSAYKLRDKHAKIFELENILKLLGEE